MFQILGLYNLFLHYELLKKLELSTIDIVITDHFKINRSLRKLYVKFDFSKEELKNFINSKRKQLLSNKKEREING